LKKVISKSGTIIKREPLKGETLFTDQDFLLIKTKDPFPGYYCSDKDYTDISCKEMAWYIPVSGIKEDNLGNLAGICNMAENDLGIQACPGLVSLKGKNSYAIRFKGEIRKIVGLKTFLVASGCKVYRNQKVYPYLGEIELYMNFQLEEIDNEIYRNSKNNNLYYLPTAHHFNWKVFERLITFQKSQMLNKNFDAAIGHWKEHPGAGDFLRIFCKNDDIKTLKEISALYNRIADNYLKDKSMF